MLTFCGPDFREKPFPHPRPSPPEAHRTPRSFPGSLVRVAGGDSTAPSFRHGGEAWGQCPQVQSSPSFPPTLGSPGPDPVDTMLLSVFRKQELPEPSSDFPAAGVTSWEASSGTCFPWCPAGNCIPLNLTHIFSGLGVNLQARVATPGEPPRAPGATWDAGLVSGCCAPGSCRAGLLCLSTLPWGQVDRGCTRFRGAWAWLGLRGGSGKGFQKGWGAQTGLVVGGGVGKGKCKTPGCAAVNAGARGPR